MKTREFPAAVVTKKAKAALDGGHVWVYDTEVISYGENGLPPANGSLIDVISENGRYLGTGMISLHSKIRIRLLSRNANDRFDEAFFCRRIGYAWDYRKTVMGRDTDSCRCIFGEADGFPGLTVDKFEDILVTQTLSIGMEQLKPVIFPLLYEIIGHDCPIRGIYERNDVGIRELEGLPEGKNWYALPGVPLPDTSVVRIRENGILYDVDFVNGQKTGFFLDQKYNRRAIAEIAQGRRVLDCFTHTGSFALNAAAGGAAHVTAVDVSADAIASARRDALLNRLDDRMDFVCENVFDLLPRLEKEGGRPYDFIILDPPAFTKSRKTVNGAARGYKEINYRAMKLLPRGGYLATCSCSHFMDNERFIQMLRSAASDAAVELKLVEVRRQAPDHPVLLNIPDTDYLKFYIFQVI